MKLGKMLQAAKEYRHTWRMRNILNTPRWLPRAINSNDGELPNCKQFQLWHLNRVYSKYYSFLHGKLQT